MKSAIVNLLLCALNVGCVTINPNGWLNWIAAFFCFGMFILATKRSRF